MTTALTLLAILLVIATAFAWKTRKEANTLLSDFEERINNAEKVVANYNKSNRELVEASLKKDEILKNTQAEHKEALRSLKSSYLEELEARDVIIANQKAEIAELKSSQSKPKPRGRKPKTQES
jgi:Fe2+ transport system protein B